MTSSRYILELEIPAYGGASLGRLPDGRAVFVPYAMPGEKVCVRLVEEKRGYARAELLEVLEPSVQRTSPRCKHFGICGGCHYQFVSYAAQLTTKTEILRDQLQRIGKIGNPPVKPIVPSPAEWNYRNHVQFHLTPDGALGFVKSGVRDDLEPPSSDVLAIVECHLPESPLNKLWPQLNFDPGTGLDRVSLRLGADEEVMIVLESEDVRPPEAEIEARLSVVHLVQGDAVVLAGRDYILMEVKAQHTKKRGFQVSAASFFQVNTPMAGAMVDYLLADLPLSPATTLIDVYCGVGLFSAFLAPQVGRVISLEIMPSAWGDFTNNLDQFDHVELYQASAEDVLPMLDAHPDIVIVDPPRAGLDRRVLEALKTLKPSTLAYVSCDPSTLARDAARLIAGGYTLRAVTPFDLFPQTYHIESISIFTLS